MYQAVDPTVCRPLIRRRVVDKERNREIVPQLLRVGHYIATMAKRVGIPISKLAQQVGLTTEDWHAVEEGKLRLSYSALTKILDLLGIPLEAVFNARTDDFFPFVWSTWGKDPDDLEPEEADEAYGVYLDLGEGYNREAMPQLRRVGQLIRAMRKRGRNPTRKLADKVSLTIHEWYAIEQGAHRLRFSTLRSVLDLLDIPVKTVFSTRKDDFFPFVRLTWGSDPGDLEPEEADEIYDLYLEVLEFRRERSKVPGKSGGNADKKED